MCSSFLFWMNLSKSSHGERSAPTLHYKVTGTIVIISKWIYDSNCSFFLLDVQKMYATSPYTDTVMTPEIGALPVDTGDGLIWVVGPVLAVVFIICIVIAILLYKKWVDFAILHCKLISGCIFRVVGRHESTWNGNRRLAGAVFRHLSRNIHASLKVCRIWTCFIKKKPSLVITSHWAL